ncbi:MAG: energy-coupling factor transporter transmembrane protein EcfT [Clostridia bacterium]|nr:energy-coupling factor transporter transmembrane protein EcfT [Clostridia bacterium]
MRDVSFGQYYPATSFAHKCDPRTKIILLIVYIAAIFTAKNFYGLGVCALAFIVMTACSKVPFKTVFKTVKGIAFLLVFTAALNLFFYSGGTPLTVGGVTLKWGMIRISKEGMIYTVFLASRLLLLVVGSSLLTLTTTPVSLTDGIESLLSPLKYIRFPVRELALIMSIALRFIPILSDETGRIMNAQKARGADFETGGLVKKVKAVVPVLIPLLISSFRRADELGDAMDARCYSGGKTRTKYKKLAFGWRDWIAFVFGVALLTGVILFRSCFGGVV